MALPNQNKAVPAQDDDDDDDSEDSDFNLDNAREELELSEEEDHDGEGDPVEESSAVASAQRKRKPSANKTFSARRKFPYTKTKADEKIRRLRQAVLRVEGEQDPTPRLAEEANDTTNDDEEEEEEGEDAATAVSMEEEKARRKAKVDGLWKEMNQLPQKTRTSSLIPSSHTKGSRAEPEPAKIYQYAGKQFTVTASGTVISGTPTTNAASTSATTTSNPASPGTTSSSPVQDNDRPRLKMRQRVDLDAIAARYGVAAEVQKLTSLEKSKLDWQQFVAKEGIADELKLHNKDGYLERRAFLQRADDRVNDQVTQLRKDSRSKKLT
ncbi:hypothetical protein SeMB42_g04807 [Synchytrium endobioticum]|uniref:SWR1-complex protein 5 n=1 Tax=Synchytrium endobioticum TaxID=286115 RepID=A0A507D3B4_9FUNG|nr:hypothetical protein SeMB42_g04807 [Synchytrium endobioticum]TPX45966.1 hypothetical protein SeLEV6574_g03522 [Synchytrium endobioticum]